MGSDLDGPEGGEALNVKYVVINRQTKLVLRTMYGSSGYSRPSGYGSVGEVDGRGRRCNRFCALFGTDNVKGRVWLLNDYAVEMGRKTISEIWTRWELLSSNTR